MLELNVDIYDSSKKFVLGSVFMSHVKTEESRQTWLATVGDLKHLMEYRAQLLKGNTITKDMLLTSGSLPDRIKDAYGSLPVVVWLGTLDKEKAGGKQRQPEWGQRSVRECQWWSSGSGSQGWSQG